MSNAPAHTEQHHQLMQLVVKTVEAMPLIDGIVIITIGHDGRPCVGGNFSSPVEMTNILRQLIDMDE